MKKYFATYGSFLAIVFVLGGLVGLSKHSHSGDILDLVLWAPWLTFLVAVLFGLIEWNSNITERYRKKVAKEHEAFLDEEFPIGGPKGEPGQPGIPLIKVATITKSESPFAWYYKRAGEKFQVEGCEDAELWHTVRCIATHRREGEFGFCHRGWIRKVDCVIEEVLETEWNEDVK